MTSTGGPHVVVAGLLRRAGRGLLLHRTPGRAWYPDRWDLPGGHVEDDETPDAALARELREELGVTAVVTGAPFARFRGEDFRMGVWVVDRWDGEPGNRDQTEHDALAWLDHRELARAAARRPAAAGPVRGRVVLSTWLAAPRTTPVTAQIRPGPPRTAGVGVLRRRVG